MKMNSSWFANEGASVDVLNAVRAVAPRELPCEYYLLLECSNGGEGALPEPFYNLCLDSAERASDLEQIAVFEDIAPGLFVIGGNGGLELFAFDLRLESPWPIVMFDGVDPEGSLETVANSFAEFIALIG